MIGGGGCSHFSWPVVGIYRRIGSYLMLVLDAEAKDEVRPERVVLYQNTDARSETRMAS